MKLKNIYEVEGVEVPEPFKRRVRVVFAPDQDRVRDLDLVTATIYPHSSTDYRPRNLTELIIIASGKGILICNGRNYDIGKGTAILVEQGDTIQIKNTGSKNLELFSIHIPPVNAKELYQTLLKAAKIG
ncbi:AraC family ligand binding domain-containing protein [Atrimonas thermophila]|jgi:mannose-6-phosphate isomerase-like protein (cupin superfamily)|uniref:AraC family ligand binding domain-containing protein n=1 Tax=Atrimonas thermophila TaxID=3064161 RepID=UPI00399CC59F